MDPKKAQVGSLKEKLDLCDMVLTTMPNRMSALETKCEELNGQVSSDHERLDSISQDLLYIMEQVETLAESSGVQQKLLDILEKLKRFQSEIDELNHATATLMADSSSRQMAFEDLHNILDTLKTSKADKDAVFEILDKKADIDLVDGKIGHAEFSEATNEIYNQLKSLLSRLMSNEEHLRNSVEEMLADVANKLSRDDFDVLQTPLQNKVKNLWAKLKQLRRLLDESLNPSAAGVTKCISCGRPAQLAGRDITISGGPDGMRRMDFSEKSVPVRGVSPYDPEAGGASVISLPDDSMRMEVDLLGLDGRHYKGLVNVKHHETDDENLDLSVMYRNDGMPQIISRPPSTPNSVSSQTSLRTTSLAPRKQPPSKKQKQTRREDQLFSKTRYVGGKHTVGKPSQKGAIHSKFVVPPRKSREDMGLMGTDKQMYRGTVIPKPQKRVDDDDEDVDAESEQLLSLAPEIPSSRRKKTPETRFCGGRHTITKPNQRGTSYSKVQVDEDTWEEDTFLVGSDKNVYRGLEYKDPSEVRSQGVMAKSKTKVDLIGSSGRIISGCMVDVPRTSQLKEAKKEKKNRKRIFLHDKDY